MNRMDAPASELEFTPPAADREAGKLESERFARERRRELVRLWCVLFGGALLTVPIGAAIGPGADSWLLVALFLGVGAWNFWKTRGQIS